MDVKNINNHRFNKNIKTLFFDVGGVLLIDFIDDKIIDLAKKYNKNAKILLNAREKYRSLADLGRISDSSFWKYVLNDVGINASEEDWQVNNYMKEIEGMRDIAQSLKKSGYNIAILSNDSKDLSAKRCNTFGFAELFHDLIISSEHGVIKPDPDIYWIALRRMKTLPEDSLLIDDRLENLKTALDLGMHTILFRGIDQLQIDLISLGINLF